jgi:hypothetical protein
MALGPINYQMQVATPFESVLQGMSAGAKLADIEVARAQREAQTAAIQQKAALEQQAADRLNAFERARATYFANPNRSGEDFDRLLAQAPDKDQLAALKAAAESRGTERLANDKRFYGQLQMALEVNPEIAKSMLSERIAGEQNAQDRKGLEIILEGLKVSPEKALEGIEYVGGGAFGKDWVEANAKIRQARREAALFGPGLREATAKADQAVADAITAREAAKNAPEKAAADAAFAKAQAAKAKVEAEYAERVQKATLNKLTREIQDTGARVQSSSIKPDGTVVLVTSKGETRVIGPDGVELTGEARVEAVRDAEKFGADIQALRSGARAGAEIGQKEAAKAFEAVGKVRTNLNNLDAAVAALDAGANTGVIASRFPNWKASTIELKNIQNRLGLDVIGSVTFGALSEGELSLALETALPLNMSEPQLRDWLIRKRDSQNKLADYLSAQARYLSVPGRTVGNWMEEAERRYGAGGGPGGAAAIPGAPARPGQIPGAAPGQRAPAPAAGQRNVTVNY